MWHCRPRTSRCSWRPRSSGTAGERWAGTVRGGVPPSPSPGHTRPAPVPPRLTSVWMMLQALVRPTLPGVPYRCRPFFRSRWAYLSICRMAGPRCGQLHLPRPDPRPRWPPVPSVHLPAVTPPRRHHQALAPQSLPGPLVVLITGSESDASARAYGS